MRLQQQLALCMLACIACTAIARTTGDGYDKEYEKEGYKYDGDYYADKPECGLEQFPELKDALCVNTKKGKPIKLEYYAEDCVIDKEDWCKPVDKKWGCAYEYKKKGDSCRAASGPCDVADTCSGYSADCEDKVADKKTVCLKSESVCIKDAKCDGVEKSCPAPKDVAKGTPCKHDGIYSEAYGEDGKVALQSTVNAEIAKKHGWGTCHRCYEGECTAFKYEWYKNKPNKKHGKSSKKHNKHDDEDDHKKSDKHDKDEEYEKKSYKKSEEYKKKSEEYEKKGDKYEKSEEYKKKSEEHDSKKGGKYDEDDEWYISEHDDYSEEYAKLEGYEPEVYCKKNEDKDKSY